MKKQRKMKPDGREIRFRIWNEGKFYNWGFIKNSVTRDLIFVGLPDLSREPSDLQYSSQEFIGYDKKGKDVFVGDVVKFPQGLSNNADLDFVLVYVARRLTDNKIGVYLDWLREIRDFEPKEVIVVGNMFENPELLKEIRKRKNESVTLSQEIGKEIKDEEHYPNQRDFAIPNFKEEGE